MLNGKHTFAAALLLLVGGFAARPGEAADEPVDWRTGRAFEQQLTMPVSLHWPRVPLRSSLERLAGIQRVAMMLDRRIDPNQLIELQLHEVPLQTALEQIAATSHMGVTRLGPLVYFGPPAATRQLRTLAAAAEEPLAALAPSRQQKWLARASWGWEALSTPRELLETLARENSFTIENLELVPHDLWPQVSWPSLSLIERMTLLLIGFDLTFEITGEGSAVVLVPIGEPATLVRTYTVGPQAETVAQRIAPFAPQAAIRVERDQLIVRGRAEEHETIARALRGEPMRRTTTRRKTQAGEKVLTLNVQNSRLGALVQQLAGQLGLELQIDEAALRAAGVDLEKLVSLQVQNVSLDELLTTILAPQGLDFRVIEKRLEVFPASENPPSEDATQDE